MALIEISDLRKELYLDPDFDAERLERYVRLASSYLFKKTGFDWSAESEPNPLAQQALILYIRQIHYNGASDKDFDYTVGLTSLIIDLQTVAIYKKEASEVDSLIADIPTLESITINDSGVIVLARDAYDLLTKEAQEYVLTYSTLVASEAKIEELGG